MGEFTWARGELNADFQNWYITRGSVLLSEDRLQLSLPASKTDPFRQGVTLTIAATGVTDSLRQTLKELVFSGNYSGHSFRRGVATSARETGLSDAEIQLLGRWKSDAYKLYIQANPARIWIVSKRHQK